MRDRLSEGGIYQSHVPFSTLFSVIPLTLFNCIKLHLMSILQTEYGIMIKPHPKLLPWEKYTDKGVVYIKCLGREQPRLFPLSNALSPKHPHSISDFPVTLNYAYEASQIE